MLTNAGFEYTIPLFSSRLCDESTQRLVDRSEKAPGGLIDGRYRLERQIGTGGCGVVFSAYDLEADRPVAIKLLHPDARAADVGRLHLEAEIEAELDHPGLVRAWDFGYDEGGTPFLTMELLVGESLGTLLARRWRLPAAEAVRVLLPIVEAMCVAHSHGVLHLDIKPENVFIAQTADGSRPKLLDFGIAKRIGCATNAASACGAMNGSPGYMSPEQARGFSDVDARADVWALCVVLYEMVQGTPAFTGLTCLATVRAVLDQQLRPFSGSAEAASLWPIVATGLHKDRSLRFRSMRSLGRALAGWLLAHGFHDDVCGSDLTETWQLGAADSVATAA